MTTTINDPQIRTSERIMAEATAIRKHAEASGKDYTKPSDALNVRQLTADCESYLRYRRVEADAKADADAIKLRIIAACEDFGKVPDSAQKSKRIEAPDHIVTMTVGTKMEVDDEACGVLYCALKLAKRANVFSRLFAVRKEYTLVPGARDVLKQIKWPEALKVSITMLFSNCFDAKSNSPSVTVESRKEDEQRKQKAAEDAAARQAEKDAKAASKKVGRA